MCMSPTTLNHKVSPTYDGAMPSVLEAAEICEATGDMGPLHAFGARLAHVCIPVADCDGLHDGDAQQLARTVGKFGDFIVQAATALADGNVTGNELARIEREGTEALCAVNALMQHARAVHRVAIGGRS